jgi:hypothetical protein
MRRPLSAATALADAQAAITRSLRAEGETGTVVPEQVVPPYPLSDGWMRIGWMVVVDRRKATHAPHLILILPDLLMSIDVDPGDGQTRAVIVNQR